MIEDRSTTRVPPEGRVCSLLMKGGGRHQTAVLMEKRCLLMMWTPSFATRKEEMLQERKVKVSGERAGLVIYTAAPSGLLLWWRRDSFDFPDLVFFHGVAVRSSSGICRHPLPGPIVTRGGRWELEQKLGD